MKKSYRRKELKELRAEWEVQNSAHDKVSKAHWEAHNKYRIKEIAIRQGIILDERMLEAANPWSLMTHGNEAFLYAKGPTDELEKAANDGNGYHYSFDIIRDQLELRVDDSEVKLIQKAPGALDKAVDDYGLVVDVGDVGKKISELRDQLGTFERIYSRFAKAGAKR